MKYIKCEKMSNIYFESEIGLTMTVISYSVVWQNSPLLDRIYMSTCIHKPFANSNSWEIKDPLRSIVSDMTLLALITNVDRPKVVTDLKSSSSNLALFSLPFTLQKVDPRFIWKK